MEKLIPIEIIRHYWGSTAQHIIRVPENMVWSRKKSDSSDYYNYCGVGCHLDWEDHRMEANHDMQVVDSNIFDNTTWVCLRDIEAHPFLDARCVDSVIDCDPGDLRHDVWVEIADGKHLVAAMKIEKVSHPVCALTMIIKTHETEYKGRTFSMMNDACDLTHLMTYDSIETYHRGSSWIKCTRHKGERIWAELVKCVHAKMLRMPYKPDIELDLDAKQIPLTISSETDNEKIFEDLQHICVASEEAKQRFVEQFI